MHEAWATIAGAVCMLLFGCVTLEQAWLSILSGANVLFFLLALMSSLHYSTVRDLTNLLFSTHSTYLLRPSQLTCYFHRLWRFRLTTSFLLLCSARHCRKHTESDLLQPSSAIKNDRFFKLSLFVLVLVLVGYFVGCCAISSHTAVALAGRSILLIGGFGLKQIAWSELRREVSWELFPFVIGLFVVVKAVENIGIASFAVSLLKQLADHDFFKLLL